VGIKVVRRRGDGLRENRGRRRRALAVQVDVRQPADLDRAFDAAMSRFGGLDVLVNNAGVSAMAPLADIDAAMFDAAMATNVRSIVETTRRAAVAFDTAADRS
jgi:NAD(P)-dependent dehydrogenase (short-subunit alcohol dehydrogenase family)